MLNENSRTVYFGSLPLELTHFDRRRKELEQGGWIYFAPSDDGGYIFRRPIDPNPEGEK